MKTPAASVCLSPDTCTNRIRITHCPRKVLYRYVTGSGVHIDGSAPYGMPTNLKWIPMRPPS